jgi:hypothetical protein
VLVIAFGNVSGREPQIQILYHSFVPAPSPLAIPPGSFEQLVELMNKTSPVQEAAPEEARATENPKRTLPPSPPASSAAPLTCLHPASADQHRDARSRRAHAAAAAVDEGRGREGGGVPLA